MVSIAALRLLEFIEIGVVVNANFHLRDVHRVGGIHFVENGVDLALSGQGLLQQLLVQVARLQP